MSPRVDQLMVCITMQIRKILPIFDAGDAKKMTEAEQIIKCIAQVVQTVSYLYFCHSYSYTSPRLQNN